MRAYYIGAGSIRTLLFAGLRANLVVMTMPELQTAYIRRSPHVRHYAYVHHSLVSSHMVYRERAFDHFDSIFCAGPHHAAEVRAREQQAGLPEKTLIEHGYGRLDSLIEAAVSYGDPQHRPPGIRGRVLIAPSWGENALLERHGGGFIKNLLERGFQVTLRPHPQTKKFFPAVLEEIVSCYCADKKFALDEDMASMRSLREADIMISDWSGAAIEFAFAFERPVIFVDVPRKVNNPSYDSLGIEPFEVSVRDKIGRIVPEHELHHIADVVSLLMGGEMNTAMLRAQRDRAVFNVGHSGSAGAQALARLAGLSE
jgi:YidC/Oxa1 family membrane protein insertase